MKLLSALALLIGLALPAAAASAYKAGPTINTTTGKVSEVWAGSIAVAPSSAAIGSPTLLMSGTSGYLIGAGANASPVFAVNVKAFGAKNDGVTLNDTAVANAIASLPAAGGAIYFPAGTSNYLMASYIECGDKQITFIGDGWRTLVADDFGDPQWLAPGAITGSVLKFANNTDGIRTTATNPRKVYLEHIGILGSGAGTTNGLNFGAGSSNSNFYSNDVIVANFKVGMLLEHSIDNSHTNLYLTGNTTGLYIKNDIADTRFYNLTVQSNEVGIAIGDVSHVNFYGGLVQSNSVSGISLRPQLTGITGVTFDGMWSEANGVGIFIQATTAPVTAVSFKNMRESTPYTLDLTPASFSISRITFMNCEYGAVTLNFGAAGINLVTIIGGAFAAVTGQANVQGLTQLQNADSLNSGNHSSDGGYTLTYAATVNPDMRNGEVQKITLTGDVTISTPTNAPIASKITYIIRQDGTGGRAVTWTGGHISQSWSDAGNAASAYSAISFYQIAVGQWIQVGEQSKYPSGPTRFTSKTIAQLLAITPALRDMYWCSNCSPLKIVIATGTSAGNWADAIGGDFK